MKKTFALFAKKAMVYVLTAAMLVSTPMTAGATEDVPAPETTVIDEDVPETPALDVVAEPTTVEEPEEVVEEEPTITEEPEAAVEEEPAAEDPDAVATDDAAVAEEPEIEEPEIEEPEATEEVVEEEAVEEEFVDEEEALEVDYSDAFVDDFEKTLNPGVDISVGGSGTDTITDTDTTTGTYSSGRAAVVGLAFAEDQKVMDLDDNRMEEVEAIILFDDYKNVDESLVKALAKRVRWHVYKAGTFNPDTHKGITYVDDYKEALDTKAGETEKYNKKDDKAQPLGISLVDKTSQDRTKVQLTAKMGCKVDLVADISYDKADNAYVDFSGDYFYAKMEVIVKNYATGVTIDLANSGVDKADAAKKTAEVYYSRVYNMKATLEAAAGTGEATDQITWVVDNTKYATINAKTGVLTVKKKAGTVKVTAFTEKGHKDTVTLTVSEGTKVTSNTIMMKDGKTAAPTAWDVSYTDGDSKKAALGKKDKLSTTFELKAVTNSETAAITWKSSKASIAKVESTGRDTCKVTVVGTGKVTISAKPTSGMKTAKLRVNVSASLISVDVKDVTMYIGQSRQLVYTRYPAMNKDVIKFKAESTKPVKVSAAGLAKATKKAAELTDKPVKVSLVDKKMNAIKGLDGKNYDINVTVKTNTSPIKVTAISRRGKLIKDNSDIIQVGQTAIYSVTTSPEKNGALIEWKASGKAFVIDGPDADGTVRITATKKGKTTVKLTSYYLDGNRIKTEKTTLQLASSQPAKSMTLKKTNFVVKAKKNGKATISATLNPKGADKGIEVTAVGTAPAGYDFSNAAKANKNSQTVKVNAEAGSKAMYMAKAKSGVAKVGYIYAKEESKGAIIGEKIDDKKAVTGFSGGKTTLTVGTPLMIYPGIKVGKNSYVSADGDKYEEIVEFTASKPGYVNVIKTKKGYELYGLQGSNGKTIKLTGKTISGKKAVLKITITEATAK